MADQSQIDPRLFASTSTVPPRTQLYNTSASQQNTGHPYYLPSPTAQHHAQSHPHPHHQSQTPQLSQPAPLANILDPALEQTSPAGPEHDHDHDDDDHDEGDHDGAHGTPGSGKSPADLKRPRACDSCRGLKVRCDQERPDVSCRRCAKAGRACITTPPTRKRQKKADSRVAELERKIDALTATLHAQKAGGQDVGHHGGIPQHEASTNAIPMAPDSAYRLGSLSHEWSNSVPNRYPDIPPGYGPAQNIQRGPESKRRKLETTHATIPEDMDAIHRDLAEHPEMRRTGHSKIYPDHSHINGLIDQLMSPETAERVFFRYVNDICPHFPAVPFPPGTTAREVREKKPLLFLSVLAGSSHGSAEHLVSQETQRELTKLLKDQLADIIWRNGEKSLEIVQALHIAVLWYRPPLHFEQHNFYMMVNCAAVMALDLGLGRKATPNVMKLSVGPFKRYHPNSSSIEARRTFLVCYYLCMSITMVLRRPILLRWTNYMADSVRILESSPEALPSDKLLCQQVKMAHIGEKISVEFCMDDPSVEVAISDPKVIYALKIFENELSQLREENMTIGDLDPTLRLSEHVTNLYLHEIALHQNQGSADLQPPYISDSLSLSPSLSSGVKKDAPVGPAHIGALGDCLAATHGILDTILSIQLDILLTLPVIFCVRAIYAIVCLMKMWVSVTSSGEVSSIIKKEDLQIEVYTEQLVAMFNAIVSRDAQSPHGKFYYVAKRLQERFAHIKEGAAKDQHQDSDYESSRNASQAPSTSTHQSANQTPLHLLSEVAMGSSNNAASQQQQQQTQAHTRSQQQAQAALQAHAQHSQQAMPPNWYPNMAAQPTPDMMGLNGQPHFDINFDFTQFDLGTGSDADLSALFIPDSMAMWNFNPDPNMQGYTGY
ncbi:Fungal Zn binuclear cluster domain containing protein [Pyrenophora tritici-repentis]|uniref:Fungal Zn binuclear cluster domain containing protein n=1 Tax=Pyrenophora tritici-repentis TaxID=45151 RepID=A0A922NK52_9PLEO|nr:Fungal Zn binuclear cluster domain containing protein [Pyrenophora tritici-repentis]KAI1671253.1 Fungal Zn binuclear cluster domain containing protein [Pyrenophora tritici-repentis]KAI1685064.1 Fungal Zn binuclear cluster domain containing protein [Pyrenophora tritici-repentis]